MAVLVPSWSDLEQLPQALKPGERHLLNALLEVLEGDDWTIYAQPHVNGLRPDVIIFNPNHGIGIFEVKDWSLGAYRIDVSPNTNHGKVEHYNWVVHKANGKIESIRCPFQQVEHYRDVIYKFEIPNLGAETAVNKSAFALISTFVYFHGHDHIYLEEIPDLTKILGKYRNMLGQDDLQREKLISILSRRNLLGSKSRFAPWMDKNIAEIQNAFYPALHGKTDLKYLNYKLTNKQQDLLDSSLGKRRRVIGSAGSGKTFVLVRKAVLAAKEKRKTVLVAFNITMGNYLRDLIGRLCRYFGPTVHYYVIVTHYHALRYGSHFDELEDDEHFDSRLAQKVAEPNSGVPLNRLNAFRPEILLVDEGQDFEKSWLEWLEWQCVENRHLMFMADDRQSIYKLRFPAWKSFVGQPNKLNETLRIPPRLARLANALYTFSNIESESEPLVSAIEAKQEELWSTARWYNAPSVKNAQQVLVSELKNMWEHGQLGQPVDNVVLVCQVSHGWEIEYGISRTLGVPRSRAFESKSENVKLRQQFGLPDDWGQMNDVEYSLMTSSEKFLSFKKAQDSLRRKYKVQFRMRNLGLKLSTIHSFKGWELENIFILFAPDEKQYDMQVGLLYTALTRTQHSITIFNASPDLVSFGEYAIQNKLVDPL